jgi:hypothetical protein
MERLYETCCGIDVHKRTVVRRPMPFVTMVCYTARWTYLPLRSTPMSSHPLPATALAWSAGENPQIVTSPLS